MVSKGSLKIKINFIITLIIREFVESAKTIEIYHQRNQRDQKQASSLFKKHEQNSPENYQLAIRIT